MLERKDSTNAQKRMTDEEIDEKLRLFSAQKLRSTENTGDDAGQLIKADDYDAEESINFKDTSTKLYHMFGGYRILMQIGAFQMLTQMIDHQMRRIRANWSTVEPEKQLENLPTALKEIVVGTTSQRVIDEGKDMYMSYRNRELGSRVHATALDKVMHGSVNQYFDVNPVGRIIGKFNDEINVFKGGLMNTF